MESNETNSNPIINNFGKLAEALAKAQAKFSVPKKSKTVDFTSPKGRTYYKYADLADVIDASKVGLSENGLAITQKLTYQGDFFGLETLLIHSSGQFIESWHPLPDPTKTDPKLLGSLITYARRYSLSPIIGIASDEDDDGGETAQPAPKENRAPQAHSAPQENPSPDKWEPSPAQLARLNAIARDQNWTHQDILDTIEKKPWYLKSTKELSREQYDKLCKYIEVTPLEKGKEEQLTPPLKPSPSLSERDQNISTPPSEYIIDTGSPLWADVNGKRIKDIPIGDVNGLHVWFDEQAKTPGVKGLGKIVQQKHNIEKFLQGVKS